MEQRQFNLKILINKINQIISDLVKLQNSYNNNLSNARMASINRSIAFNKHKLRSYLSKLDKLGNGNIIEITYIIEGEKYKGIFTNIKKSDIVLLLKFRSQMVSKEIKILEIKDIPTGINKVIL